MKPHISCDGGKDILRNVMKCNIFPTIGTTKESESLLDLKVGHKCVNQLEN